MDTASHYWEGYALDHHTPGRFGPWSQEARSSVWLLTGPKRAWPDKMTVTYSNRLQQCIQKRCTRILDPIVKERSAWTTIQSADVNCRIKKPSPCYELSLRFKACLTSPEDQHLFKTATAMWQKNCTSMLGPITEKSTPWTIIYLDDLCPIVMNQSHRYESWPVQSVSDQWSWPSLIQIFKCIKHSVHGYCEPLLRMVGLGPPYTRLFGP